MRTSRRECTEVGAVVGKARERGVGELPRAGKPPELSAGEEVLAARLWGGALVWSQRRTGSGK